MAKGQLPTRYPYYKWANGEWHTAIEGVDFKVSLNNFRIAVNAWARKNGKTVQYKIFNPGVVELRFLTGGPYCGHCYRPFEKRSSNNQYCETCVPRNNPAATMRMSNYKLCEANYQLMLTRLDEGFCPICDTWKATVVDHDHNCCGLVKDNGATCGQCTRGVLCVGCNIMIQKVEAGQIDAPPNARFYLENPTYGAFCNHPSQ